MMPYLRRMTKRRGVGDLSDFLCSVGILTPGSATCSAASAAQSAALGTPTLAPGSVSPGLPVGYNPETGLIADNTSGATQVNPYSPDLTGYPTTTSPTDLASSLASIPGWAWAVGLTLGAVVLMNAFGGRR
jgi:hypothetical protein